MFKKILGKAKETYEYAHADKERRRQLTEEKKLLKIAESNDRWVEMECANCGIGLKVNSVFCGKPRQCFTCNHVFTVPTFAEYLRDKPPTPDPQPQLAEAPAENQPDYHDLESAILYFNGKAQKIDKLPINEDEKEMLLIKLQEKRERILDEFI